MNLRQIGAYWATASRDSTFEDFQKAVTMSLFNEELAEKMKRALEPLKQAALSRQAFPDPLVLETTGAYKWRVCLPFHYVSKSGARFTVREGFETDLASIPRFLQWLPHLHPNGRCRRSAVLHDWLYASLGQYGWERKQADEIFREALQAEGLSKRTATVYYWAVRLFGGRAWRK
jgi:hypothetical protein